MRASSSRASACGIFPQFGFPEVLKCQMFAGIEASFAMRNTSSIEESIAFPSERWCVK